VPAGSFEQSLPRAVLALHMDSSEYGPQEFPLYDEMNPATREPQSENVYDPVTSGVNENQNVREDVNW
jgi:hypothetical protein